MSNQIERQQNRQKELNQIHLAQSKVKGFTQANNYMRRMMRRAGMLSHGEYVVLDHIVALCETKHSLGCIADYASIVGRAGEAKKLAMSRQTFSKHIKALEERCIIIRDNIIDTRSGKPVIRKRKNFIIPNPRVDEWVPRDRKERAYTLTSSSLKCRLEKSELESNPLLIDEYNVDTKLYFSQVFIHQEPLMTNLVRQYGMRAILEVLSENKEELEYRVNAESFKSVIYKKLKEEHYENIRTSNIIYAKRHKSMLGDFKNINLAILKHYTGEIVKDSVLSSLYNLKRRNYNLRLEFLVEDRHRKNIRLALLNKGLGIKVKECRAEISLVKDAVYCPKKSLSNRAYQTKYIKEQLINDVKIPAGQYPVSSWSFDDEFVYPQFDAHSPDIEVGQNGKVYKTKSSELTDKFIAFAGKSGVFRSLSPDEEQSVLMTDDYYSEYMQVSVPNFDFVAEMPPKNATYTTFYETHARNLARLFDMHLISASQLEMGILQLIDKTISRAGRELSLYELETPFDNYKCVYEQDKRYKAVLIPAFGLRRELFEEYKAYETAFRLDDYDQYQKHKYGSAFKKQFDEKRLPYFDPYVCIMEREANLKAMCQEMLDETQYEYDWPDTPETEDIAPYLEQDSLMSDEDWAKMNQNIPIAPPPLIDYGDVELAHI